MCFDCIWFFFFKQKTAYEMHISDWSSDVCSSDLGLRGRYAMTDSEVKAPKIEFPCEDYPIKVIGDTGVGFKDKIIAILEKHATVDHKTLAERQSTNGTYTTIQLHIIATGQEQL